MDQFEISVSFNDFLFNTIHTSYITLLLLSFCWWSFWFLLMIILVLLMNLLKIGRVPGFATCASIHQICPLLLSSLGKRTYAYCRNSSLTALLMNPLNCNYPVSLTSLLLLVIWCCSLQYRCCIHNKKSRKCCKIRFA